MSFCEHCEGQRFDRARVLRTLRQLRRELRSGQARRRTDDVLDLALQAVRELDIPHMDYVDTTDEVVH